MTTPPRPRMGLLFTSVLLELVGFAMILPLLPFYAGRLGASAFGIGVLFSGYSFAQLLLAPAWGRLSDRVGRRPVLLGTIAGNVGGHLLFAAAGGYWTLLGARLVTGGSAAVFPVAQAAVADVTTPHDRSRRLGMLGAAFGLAFTVGPALGGLLGRIDHVLVPLAAATLGAANLLLVWLLLPEPRRGRPPATAAEPIVPDRRGLLRGELRRPHVVLLGLFFCVTFAFSTMEATLALFCDARHGFGVAEIAWLFAFVGLLGAAVQGLLLGRLVGRFGERSLILAGILFIAGGLLLVPLAPAAAPLVAAVALLAVGLGLHNPSLFGLLSQQTRAEGQGTVLGLGRSTGALARVVGPVWGGWLFQAWGPEWPYWISGAMMVLVLAVAVGATRRFARSPRC